MILPKAAPGGLRRPMPLVAAASARLSCSWNSLRRPNPLLKPTWPEPSCSRVKIGARRSERPLIAGGVPPLFAVSRLDHDKPDLPAVRVVVGLLLRDSCQDGRDAIGPEPAREVCANRAARPLQRNQQRHDWP